MFKSLLRSGRYGCHKIAIKLAIWVVVLFERQTAPLPQFDGTCSWDRTKVMLPEIKDEWVLTLG
jgi:hypothetical protein